MIEIRRLQKVIEHNTALDIEALLVGAGEIAALVGPVGSGKSTLLDVLIGRSHPTAGEVTLNGFDPFEEKRRFSQEVGVLFSDDSLYKNQSPQANLHFHCRLYGLPKSRAKEVLEQVGLADRADVKLETLPSGLARRLAFGRAILHAPKVLLVEEPFARCDQASLTLLSNLMRQLAAAGMTILILADDTAHLDPVCDAIYRLSKGRITEGYHPAEAQQPALPFKIPVRLEGRVVLVNPGEILYAEAGEGRAYLHTSTERYPTQFTLGELEERLSRSGFFRAHRGYLVNLQHVAEVIPYTRNSFTLMLDNEMKTEIPLSKGAAGELRELLGY